MMSPNSMPPSSASPQLINPTKLQCCQSSVFNVAEVIEIEETEHGLDSAQKLDSGIKMARVGNESSNLETQ